MLIFPDLAEVLIEQTHVTDEITLTLRTTSLMAFCPSWGAASKRIQSRYTRKLHDLPSSGCPVHLLLHVRRFFCVKSTCPQKIFVERLPELCFPHAQRTKRLQEALCQLGFVVGGQAGVHIGSKLGISGSRDTILRLVRHHELPELPKPRVIGIDDWAWKGRLRYGTLICDLESGLPVDVLPDRSVETVSSWLQANPQLTMVSRDGSAEYASAIKKGAPQARQVSDRWHLTKNLAHCVSVLLAQCLTELRRARPVTSTLEEGSKQPPEERSPTKTRTVQRAQQARKAERLERYDSIIALRGQGMRLADIAVRMGMPERTIRQWLTRGDTPYSRPRLERARFIDPYKPYVLSRWNQGCHNGIQLEKELRAKGYRGSQRGIYRDLTTLEPSPLPPVRRSPASQGTQKASVLSSHPLRTVSVQQATWLFFRKPDELKEEERETLQWLRQASPRVEAAYHVVESFLLMMREHTGEQLDGWLSTVQASELDAFESFVTAVRQDKDAVLAGLTLPCSNGPLEGHVNRLKLIKRSMYGRAKFDLLKLRVLFHQQKSQSAKTEGSYKQLEGRVKVPRSMENTLTSQHTTSTISRVA